MPYLNYLKIKCVSLAAEAKLIRKDEIKRRSYANKANKEESFKYNDSIARGLHEHRVTIVRDESRWAHIAYGFLRGYDYKQIEGNSWRNIKWHRVYDLVEKYGEDAIEGRMQRYNKWQSDAIIYKAGIVIEREIRNQKRLERKPKDAVDADPNADNHVNAG